MVNTRRLAVVGIVVAIAATACEPCAGMGNCYGEPRFTVTGSLRHDSTGARVSRARIDFVRTGGVGLVADSTRVLTDDRGNFVLSVVAAVAGNVEGEFVVRSPEQSPLPPYEYRIVDQRLGTSPLRGDAHVFLPWSTRPSLPDLAQLLRNGAPIPNVLVEFRRTRGVSLIGAENDLFRVDTDGNGVFPLYQNYVRPRNAGDLFGDVYVDGALSYRDVRIIATPLFRPNTVMRFIDLADSLALGARR
jgi:hypothetical protein